MFYKFLKTKPTANNNFIFLPVIKLKHLYFSIVFTVRYTIIISLQILTALQEGYGSVFILRSELPTALQILKDVDIGGKTQHVLLSTAIRHSQQITDVLQSTTHQITYGQKSNIAIIWLKTTQWEHFKYLYYGQICQYIFRLTQNSDEAFGRTLDKDFG